MTCKDNNNDNNNNKDISVRAPRSLGTLGSLLTSKVNMPTRWRSFVRSNDYLIHFTHYDHCILHVCLFENSFIY